MKKIGISKIMVPLAEYNTVDVEVSLQDAVLALKSARENSDAKSFLHCNLLVIDREGTVAGKLSPLDLIRGLEEGYQKIGGINGVDRFGYNSELIKTLMERGRLWERPLKDLCRKSAGIKVKNIMGKTDDDDHIAADATLDEALHQMVMTRRHSLLAMENGRVVGVLRLMDVFEIITSEMAACRENPS